MKLRTGMCLVIWDPTLVAPWKVNNALKGTQLIAWFISIYIVTKELRICICTFVDCTQYFIADKDYASPIWLFYFFYIAEDEE